MSPCPEASTSPGSWQDFLPSVDMHGIAKRSTEQYDCKTRLAPASFMVKPRALPRWDTDCVD